MKRGIKLLSSAVLGLAAVACSSPEKMADMAENVSVKCDPAVLEVVAGNIDATVTVTYPADYFHPKAIRLSYIRARKLRTTTRSSLQTGPQYQRKYISHMFREWRKATSNSAGS